MFGVNPWRKLYAAKKYAEFASTLSVPIPNQTRATTRTPKNSLAFPLRNVVAKIPKFVVEMFLEKHKSGRPSVALIHFPKVFKASGDPNLLWSVPPVRVHGRLCFVKV